MADAVAVTTIDDGPRNAVFYLTNIRRRHSGHKLDTQPVKEEELRLHVLDSFTPDCYHVVRGPYNQQLLTDGGSSFSLQSSWIV